MKIDSSISVAMATAQQYLRQHEVYMAQAAQRMNTQGEENKNGDPTIVMQLQLGEHKQKTQSAVPQDNTSVLMIDTALNALTTSLLNMRDSLLQAITEAKDTQKISRPESDTLSTSGELSSQRKMDFVSSDKDSENYSLATGHTALSNINAALQQISKSRTVLHNMHLQTTISSLSPSPITNGTAAKERSEQTKAQILDGANKSMQSQANQDPSTLYSLL